MKILPRAPIPSFCPHCNCRMVALTRRGKRPWNCAPTRDHIFPRCWGGRDMVDNLRWCCRRCNQNRVKCGHCVAVLACVTAVSRSSGRSIDHVVRRWRLQMPVQPRPPWPRPSDNPSIATGGIQ